MKSVAVLVVGNWENDFDFGELITGFLRYADDDQPVSTVEFVRIYSCLSVWVLRLLLFKTWNYNLRGIPLPTITTSKPNIQSYIYLNFIPFLF